MVTYLIAPERNRWHLRCAETGKALMDFETREQAIKQCSHLLRSLSGEMRILDDRGGVDEVRRYPRSRPENSLQPMQEAGKRPAHCTKDRAGF